MSTSILIDGREFVLGRRTGIGRFLEGLLRALVETHPDWRLMVVVNEPQALPETLRGKAEVQKAPPYLEWHFPKLAEGYDLFLSPYPKLPVRKLPCLSIHTIHDVFYLTHPAYQGNILKRWAGLWRVKHALAKSDLTWFDSQASLEETQGLTNQFQPYQIRFPAIEPSFKPDRRIKRKDFFLFVGNGLPHKNVRVLLQAIEGTDVQLQCVGIRQSVADELCAIFPWAKQQVAFLQDVDDVALLKLYRQCAALLQPSTAEGYGYPPLEAFACATPAIVSDIPVLRETTGGFATFCAPHDWRTWQYILRNFQRDEQQVSQALDWAKQHQGKQGWAAHIQDIEALVQG